MILIGVGNDDDDGDGDDDAGHADDDGGDDNGGGEAQVIYYYSRTCGWGMEKHRKAGNEPSQASRVVAQVEPVVSADAG